MNTTAKTQADLDAERIARHISRTRDVILDLRIRFVLLGNATLPSNGSAADQRVSTSNEAPAPASLTAVDLQLEIRNQAAESARIARRTLHLVSTRTSPRTTDDRLAFIGRALSDIAHTDPSAAQAATQPLWGLWRRAGIALGLEARAYRLTDLCPYCECESLIAKPEDWVITCGNPECRDPNGRRWSWPVDAPVLVYSTDSTRGGD